MVAVRSMRARMVGESSIAAGKVPAVPSVVRAQRDRDTLYQNQVIRSRSDSLNSQPNGAAKRDYPLTPEKISGESARRVSWHCRTCSHEWEAPIYSRANGSGCKQCATNLAASAYSVPKPGQSLAERDPEIAAQWHPTLNGSLTASDVTGSSGKSAWWLCGQGHSWQAMIQQPRQSAGCPQCTLWGTSVEEIRLRHELQAAGVPIDPAHEAIQTAAGKRLLCDMICPAWKVVIEFDGNYFHRQPGSLEKDKRKTRLLTELGWTVIRVREAIPTTGEHDVLVPAFSSELLRAKATLEKLNALGFTASHYDRYLTAQSPWATKEADAEVKRPIKRSLATERPDVAAQWDAIKNDPLDARQCHGRQRTQSLVAVSRQPAQLGSSCRKQDPGVTAALDALECDELGSQEAPSSGDWKRMRLTVLVASAYACGPIDYWGVRSRHNVIRRNTPPRMTAAGPHVLG